MELKKDITTKINQLGRQLSQVPTINLIQDDIIMQDNSDLFIDTYKKLERLLDYSCEVNDAIARFNSIHGVDSFVRKRSNAKLLKSIVESALQRTKEQTTSSFVMVGDERKVTTTVHKAVIEPIDLQNIIKRLNKKMSSIQATVYHLNEGTIELSFEEDDL